MDKNYKLPAIVWLKMTDYMHGWLQYELGGELRVKNQRVVCVQHLNGARKVLRMETTEDAMDYGSLGTSLSATRRNCIDAGLSIDPDTIQCVYHATKDDMKLYVPVECPKMCLTTSGVLRPWTGNVNFGHRQAVALQKLLRDEFWNAVGEFDRQYAARMEGKRYPAVSMIEDFCEQTGTPDLYVETIRREWQRRQKRCKMSDS